MCVCVYVCVCARAYVYVYVTSMYLVCVLMHTDDQEGVVKMHWCHSTPLVYTACLDGVVRLWDARNGSTVRSWEGHSSHLLDLDITKFVE